LTKDNIDTSPREIRKFGVTFAVLGALAAALMIYKGNPHWPWSIGAGFLFLLAGLFGHSLLRPVYVAWMKFAHVLGWINTRVLLGVFFYLVLTPAGLLARAFGKDLLDLKIDRSSPTYWKKRTAAPGGTERYEHLF